MALIFYLSALSDPSTVSPIPFDMDERLAHLLLYAVLGALVWRALDATSDSMLQRHAILWAALIGTAYGLSDEVHQVFVPGRTFDPMDIAFDAAGAVLGAVAAVLLYRIRRSGRA